MRVGIDTGGTFTDCVTSWGQVLKLPSSPAEPDQAVRRAIKALGARSSDICHGTTVATNLVLERAGVRVGLITTLGFRDVLEIRRQNRPDIYDLWSQWPQPLVPRSRRFEVDERILYDGSVLRPLSSNVAANRRRKRSQPGSEVSAAWLDDLTQGLLKARVESVAVCLLFSFANPCHEQLIEEQLRRYLPADVHISLSSRVMPEAGEFERTSAAVLNAYVATALIRYLESLEQEVSSAGGRLFIMSSNGGLVTPDLACSLPLRTMLSGPAAAVIAAREIGRASGFENVIAMDAGGTSTDVSIIPGEVLHTQDGVVGQFPIGLTTLDIETVGAGGGSIAFVDAAGILHVGPSSAGAVPGPACYGQGGPFTVTDANAVLGRLGDRLLGGELRLSVEDSIGTAEPLADRLGMDVLQLAFATIRIANSNVERAIRKVSLERGYDPRRFGLIAAGGAGPQVACEIAEGLGISEVLVPEHPGVMAALGLLLANVRRDYSRTILGDQADDLEEESVFLDMERGAALELESVGNRVSLSRTVDVRYAGQSFTLSLPHGPDLARRFHEAHEKRFGYAQRDHPVESVTLRLNAVLPLESTPVRATSERRESRVVPPQVETEGARDHAEERAVYFWDDFGRLAPHQALVYNRSQCLPLQELAGPAIFEQYDSTVVVAPGWTATPLENGSMLLVRR